MGECLACVRPPLHPPSPKPPRSPQNSGALGPVDLYDIILAQKAARGQEHLEKVSPDCPSSCQVAFAHQPTISAGREAI